MFLAQSFGDDGWRRYFVRRRWDRLTNGEKTGAHSPGAGTSRIMTVTGLTPGTEHPAEPLPQFPEESELQ
jgi:hypothetical protein